MNFLLFCDKRQKRELEAIIQKTENVKLLGTEVVIRNDFLKKVFDDYNPHGVIIFSGVRMDCDFKQTDIAATIKRQRPSMRIIYYYGEIKDGEDFNETYKTLTENRIYDIITRQEIKEILPVLIKEPFTKETLDETLAVKEKTETQPEQAKPDFNIYYNVNKKVVMNLNGEALSVHEFNMLEVENITENELEYIEMDCVNIGITSLQSRAGCTHTAFELAVLIRRQNKKACVIIYDNKIYSKIAAFYGVPEMYANGGILLHNINVFPSQGVEEAKNNFNFIIHDIGSLDTDNEDVTEAYAGFPIKIMLCSAADWDLSYVTEYINNKNSLLDINYFFYPVSREKFININKRMIKSGLRAYRLQTSEEFHQPCSVNENAYLDILKRFTALSMKKNKNSGLKIKWK